VLGPRRAPTLARPRIIECSVCAHLPAHFDIYLYDPHSCNAARVRNVRSFVLFDDSMTFENGGTLRDPGNPGNRRSRRCSSSVYADRCHSVPQVVKHGRDAAKSRPTFRLRMIISTISGNNLPSFLETREAFPKSRDNEQKLFAPTFAARCSEMEQYGSHAAGYQLPRRYASTLAASFPVRSNYPAESRQFRGDPRRAMRARETVSCSRRSAVPLSAGALYMYVYTIL